MALLQRRTQFRHLGHYRTCMFLFKFCFILKNTFYHQINGIAMEFPISVRIAKMVMQFHEREIILLLRSKICFWKRCVDDSVANGLLLLNSVFLIPTCFLRK